MHTKSYKVTYIKAKNYNCWLRITPSIHERCIFYQMKNGQEVHIVFANYKKDKQKEQAKNYKKKYPQINFTFEYHD